VSPNLGEHDSAAGGGPPGGFGARIRVWRFVFEIGSPVGTRADLVEGPASDPTQLRLALSQPDVPALDQVEEALDEAESVTGKVERALDLFTGIAQGRVLDDKVVQKQVDALLDSLERLDREGRHSDVLRLARALAALLALTGRWVALVASLRMALGAAHALGDAPGIAWARHELGTLSLGAGDADAANSELQESLRIREEIGDQASAEVTQHNITVLWQAFAPNGGAGTWPKPALIAAIVAGTLLLTAGGVGATLAVLGGDDGPPLIDTTAQEAGITETPEDPTASTTEAGEGPAAVILEGPDELTNETEATFTIEAPGATRLECSLDDGDAEACLAPAVFTEIDEGEHNLVVRGFAGNTPGPPTSPYRWTVDTTPPEVKIDGVTKGAASGTSGQTVTVAFSPDDSAVRIECVLFTRTESGDTEPHGTQENCTDPAVFADLELQTGYRVRVTVADAAGNVGKPAEADFDTSTVE
jgi:hypothetical protein